MSDQLTLDVVDRTTDRTNIIHAIRQAVRQHGDTFTMNELRPLIDPNVYPPAIGSTINGLLRRRVLVPFGPPVPSDDHDSGNGNKWVRTWRVHLERMP